MSLANEAKKEKAREAKETRMWADWVEKTQKEISKEAGGEREGGRGGKLRGQTDGAAGNDVEPDRPLPLLEMDDPRPQRGLRWSCE